MEDGLTEIAVDDSVGTGLAIRYPKAWGVSAESVQYDNSNIKITSPDGKVIVYFYISINQPGILSCPEGSNYIVAQSTSDPILNYSDAQWVSLILNDEDAGLYGYFSGVIGVQNKISIGDSCGVAMKNTNISVNTKNQKYNNKKGDLFLGIRLDNVYDASSVADIDNIMTTDNFAMAKRIVRSLYKKDQL
jgi:hypothetical protein